MATKNQPQKGKVSKITRLTAFWVIACLIGLAVISLFTPGGNLKEVPINEVVSRANAGKVVKLDITGNDIEVTVKGEDRPTEKTIKEDGTIYDQGLKKDAKVQVNVKQPSVAGDVILSVITIFLPIAIIIGFFMFMMRQAQGQNNQAMSFGKSKAKLYGADKKKVLFKDVAGNEAAKQDLEEIVDFLKFPKKYEQLGAKIPRGVLLSGSPGTGKTMMARAVASEAGVPFFSISGSEFVEMFAGVGASRVRDLFSKAKKNAPSIIFVDEIDAVAHKRDTRGGNGREDEQTLNQILVEMDGFDNETGVIVIAATNRADMLDPALLRPGRFDRRITITLPERADRLEILKVHFKNKPLDSSVDLDKLAAKTAGSSGADLANIANEAAINTARANRKTITGEDVDSAFEKVAIGPERKSKIMNDKDRELSAYHEAGHAIVGHILPDSDPVHKVTIIPRGQTGGVTWFLPPEDKSYTSVYEFKDILARALGGRMAEKIVYGDDGVTTGAGSDLKHASEMARSMVTEEGMGSGLRNQVFTEDRDFFGVVKPYSDQTAEKIDEEVAKLMAEAGKRAEVVLAENRKYLDGLAKVLLDKETIEEEEVGKILKGTTLPGTAKLHN
ncbi:MAG: ATP-dependent zinc metalloprotease FtsH [Candidatus Nomurabacteria bacterium]|jgi:cell division protease FtsH|nr:ATP-dependent zinc metalloprotease FtsH [Candidatus Nomurabacteria bacterium]